MANKCMRGVFVSRNKILYLDLIVFSFLAVISEFLGNYLLNFMNVGFCISFASLICLIAMVRWGAIGSITYILAGIPMIVISESTMNYSNGFLYYVIANAFIVIPLLLWNKRDRNKLIDKWYKKILYPLVCLGFLSVGKGIAIVMITGELTGLVDFAGSMLFTLVINIILLFVLSKRDDLICDMDKYIIREVKNREEEKKNAEY